jgi:hypothetical protein
VIGGIGGIGSAVVVYPVFSASESKRKGWGREGRERRAKRGERKAERLGISTYWDRLSATRRILDNCEWRLDLSRDSSPGPPSRT